MQKKLFPNHNLAQKVGQQISDRRKKLGYTQVEVANLLGIEQESLSRMEKGIISPKFSRLERLAEVLQCSVVDLFRSEKNSPESKFNYLSEKIDTLTNKDRLLFLNIAENILEAFDKKA